MHKESIDRKGSGMFSDFQLELAEDQIRLQPFLQQIFHVDNVLEQISLKSPYFDSNKRATLVDAIATSYSTIPHTERTQHNLELLRDTTTFTVTTGHQLSLLTGPLYFIYKIIHVLKLTEKWKAVYPEYNFVPIFWLASEDHDFEEINSVEIFGQSFQWATEQKGPVGRFETTEMLTILESIAQRFEGKEDVLALLNKYKGEKNLADATMHLVHTLFGKYGLIIVQADQPKLKELFIPIMEKELKEKFSYDTVQRTNRELEKVGIKPQAHVREINLFEISDRGRNRIVPNGENLLGSAGAESASIEEWIQRLYREPEVFSPNVFLRPLYQECILPNLCYVGGVGELAYWLQLKASFEAVDIPYPMLSARTSAVWIDEITQKKLSKTGFEWKDVFEKIGSLKARYVQRSNGDEVDFSELDAKFQQFCFSINDKFSVTDPGLQKYATAETIRMQQILASMKERLIKSLKQQHEDVFKALDAVYARVYPKNSAQERSLNLFSLAGKGDIYQKIEFMYQEIDPLDTSVHVFFE